MRKWTIILGTASAFALLSGAGCRKAPVPLPPPPAPPAAPAMNAPTAPTVPDPLADDLDAAIEDLNAIE